MPRFSIKKLPEEQRIQLITEFYDALSLLKSRHEAKAFLRDLLSASETTMLMRRIEVALLLHAGYAPEDIQKMLSIGKSTISVIQKKMARADRGNGYHIITKRLLERRKRRMQDARKRRSVDPQSFESLKRRYPVHFLLNHVMDEIFDALERRDSSFTRRAVANTPSRTDC